MKSWTPQDHYDEAVRLLEAVPAPQPERSKP